MDTWLDALKLDLIVSIPQIYVIFLFVFSFLWPRPDRFFTRIFVLAFIHSVYTDTFILFIPDYLQLINTLVAYFAIIFLLFRELTLRRKLFLIFGSIVTSIASDAVTSGIAIALGHSDLDALRRDELPHLVSIMYPQLLMLVIAAWMVRRKVAKSPIALTLDFKQKKPVLKMLGLLLSQFIILGFILAVQFTIDSSKSLLMTILIYATIVVSLSAIVFLLRMMAIARTEAISSTQAVYVEDINSMFASVRGQRHDFLNHVQVIHAMAQMGKLEQLQSYTKTLVQETREVSDIINHASPVLAAFAQAKSTVALGRDISFECELPDRWDVPETAVSTLDLIKILGNLVDNAFDESALLPSGQRSVSVKIVVTEQQIALEVANRGRPIDEEAQARMFDMGYSTKGEGHSGLGLAIVQERVRHYGAELVVRSDEQSKLTTFLIGFPLGDPVV